MAEQESTSGNPQEREKPGFLQEIRERTRRKRAVNQLYNVCKSMCGWTSVEEKQKRRDMGNFDIAPDFFGTYKIEDNAKDEFLETVNSFSQEWPGVNNLGVDIPTAIELLITYTSPKFLTSRQLFVYMSVEYPQERVTRALRLYGSHTELHETVIDAVDGHIMRDVIGEKHPSTVFLERLPQLLRNGKWVKQS